MKTKITTLLLLATLVVSAPSAEKAAKPETIRVTVKGMVCSFCVQGIDKTFKRTKKVEDILVDFDTKLVALALKDGQTMKDDEIKKLVKDSGYTLGGIVRTDQSMQAIRDELLAGKFTGKLKK